MSETTPGHVPTASPSGSSLLTHVCECQEPTLYRLESASLHGRGRPPRKLFPPSVPGSAQSRVRVDLSGCVRRPDVISPFMKLFKLGKPDPAADATNSPHRTTGNSGITVSGQSSATVSSPKRIAPSQPHFATGETFLSCICLQESRVRTSTPIRAGYEHIRGSNFSPCQGLCLPRLPKGGPATRSRFAPAVQRSSVISNSRGLSWKIRDRGQARFTVGTCVSVMARLDLPTAFIPKRHPDLPLLCPYCDTVTPFIRESSAYVDLDTPPGRLHPSLPQSSHKMPTPRVLFLRPFLCPHVSSFRRHAQQLAIPPLAS